MCDAPSKVEAITFDWYGTLATHRQKTGRGALFRRYLAAEGLQSDPWNRTVLYDVFAFYGKTYRPEDAPERKRRFWIEFTTLLFQRMNVTNSTRAIEAYAESIRDIFGSSHFEVYEDVSPALRRLKEKGFRLAVISNWHDGLSYFCRELDLLHYLDVVVSSSEVGVEKPHAGIFNEAFRRLDVRPDQVVHVGDSISEDYEGAVAAGAKGLLLDRSNLYPGMPDRVHNLEEIERCCRGGLSF